MSYLRMIGLAVIAATTLIGATPGSASATTLEIGGVTQNKSVTIEASLASGTSAVLTSTSGSFLDTCTSSTARGKTEGSFSAREVGGKVSSLTFGNCTHSTVVDAPGVLAVEHAGGTNGTVRSWGASVTVQSTTFGVTLNCTTNNTDLGTLTGSASGHASLKVNANVDCGFFVPWAIWTGEYTVTSPTGLGVSA